MSLDQIKRRVDQTSAGIEHFELGEIGRAYMADHPELNRKRLSHRLVEEIRQEFWRSGYKLWPEEFPNSEQDQHVYVIAPPSALVGFVLLALASEPNDSYASFINGRVADSTRPTAGEAA